MQHHKNKKDPVDDDLSQELASMPGPNTPEPSAPTEEEKKPAKPEYYNVAVPNGVAPGTNFTVEAEGQRFQVTCPPNVNPGDIS